MAIVANRYPKVYAAVAWNSAVAVQSLQDDNSNILVLPSDYITMTQSVVIIQAWLDASFKGGRYADRITHIDTQ